MVMATLFESIDQERIEETGLEWKRRRQELSQWTVLEHYHWDWGLKSRIFPQCQTFAIEYRGEILGLMMVDTTSYFTKLFPDRGKPILYVSYIENNPLSICHKHFKYVGLQLYRTAVRHSMETGSEGRVGLHALPQAEVFYEETCGMTRLEEYCSNEGLVYFETTRIQSWEILRKY